MPSICGLISDLPNAMLSAFLWTAIVILSCAIFFCGCILFFPVSLFDPTRSIVHGMARGWGKMILFVARPLCGCKVEGLESIAKGKHYVIVSNHQSMLDILILLAALPLHFKFVAKKELFSVPVIGWHMAMADYISVDRQDPQSRKQGLLKAEEWLSKKVSVLFFSEGTRSVTGEIQSFKEGAFRVAQAQGVEILPVVLDGTWNAFPKHSWRIQKKVRFDVSIGKPVCIEKGEAWREASRKIRQEMVERLETLRERRK